MIQILENLNKINENINDDINDFKSYLSDHSDYELEFKHVIRNNIVQIGINANGTYIGAFDYELSKLNDDSYREECLDEIETIASQEIE